MARQEEKTEELARRLGEKTEESARRMGEQAAEQTRRIGLASPEATEEVAKTSANLILQNAEFFRNTWRFGADVAASIMGRSTEEVGRTLGLSGNEAQHVMRKQFFTLQQR